MTTLHHAVLFDGEREACRRDAHAYIEETWGIRVTTPSEVFTASYEQMQIDDVRELVARASLAPSGAIQVFVLLCDKVTHQAQNALLKLIEEPNTHTRFVFVVPDVAILLPTVRSRLMYIGRSVGDLTERDLASRIVVASIPERIKLMEPLYKGVKEQDKVPQRNRARRVVEAIEVVLYEEGVVARADALREVVFVRRYIQDPSSSLKMLMEHLAVTL